MWPAREGRELLLAEVVAPPPPTRFTGAKKDAATEKNEALPPSTCSALPNGVSTVS